VKQVHCQTNNFKNGIDLWREEAHTNGL